MFLFLGNSKLSLNKCNELETQEATILSLLLCIVCSVTVDNAFNLQRELENSPKCFRPRAAGVCNAR